MRACKSTCETLLNELPDLGVVSVKENKMWVVAFEPDVSLGHYCAMSSPVSSLAPC